MWILIAVLVLLVVVTAVVVTRRRPERELDWSGAHDTSARDQHWAGGAHSTEGYGGGAGEAGAGGRGGA